MPQIPTARRTVHTAEHALATRVVRALESEQSNGATPPLARSPAEPAPTFAAEASPPPPTSATAQEREGLHASSLPGPLGDIFGSLTSALTAWQGAALSLSQSRVATTSNLTAYQRKIVQNTHDNLGGTVEHAQKMLHAGNLGEALRLQSAYMQNAMKALALQADELRALALKLARDAGQPFSEQMSKALRERSGGK